MCAHVCVFKSVHACYLTFKLTFVCFVVSRSKCCCITFSTSPSPSVSLSGTPCTSLLTSKPRETRDSCGSESPHLPFPLSWPLKTPPPISFHCTGPTQKVGQAPSTAGRTRGTLLRSTHPFHLSRLWIVTVCQESCWLAPIWGKNWTGVELLVLRIM